MSSSNNRLGECEVCGASAAKYTCPKCEVKTCCLKCVNIHKKELDCDGIRDQTKYVPINKFTNLDLLSDYRMLEDINRSVETMKRDKMKRFTRINKDLPRHLYLLKEALRKRQTTLKFLPANFKRHKENTTYLDFKTHIVYWKIDWVFPQAENLTFSDEKCQESLKFSNILHKYFDPLQCDVKSLQFYQSVGLSGIKLYLRAEDKPGDKYFCLDMHTSIRQSMEHKVLIENPTIHIVFSDRCDMYEALCTDEDVDKMEVDSSNAVSYVSALVRAEEKQNTSGKQNLLFGADYSDGELSSDAEL
ncbi:uncharacterized protein CBL_07792 [Carabus blaptoides fortunei]